MSPAPPPPHPVGRDAAGINGQVWRNLHPFPVLLRVRPPLLKSGGKSPHIQSSLGVTFNFISHVNSVISGHLNCFLARPDAL